LRILIIEDNPKMASAIQRGLRAEGFLADVSHSGFEGEDLARAEPYDGIILDMVLPDKDGVDVCRNLRRRGVRTPILILSSLADVDNKLAGMNAGADDYMTKPFELEDLVARVRSLTHREAKPACARLCLDDLELDPETRAVWRGGRQLDLSAKEFELLRFLLSHQEQPLTRRDIAEGVWNVDLGEDSNVIDVYASMLRSKLGLDLSGRLQRMFEGVAGRAGPVH
jgi:DNA-binding response OmpR family regulator